jgi:hypothetical protein
MMTLIKLTLALAVIAALTVVAIDKGWHLKIAEFGEEHKGDAGVVVDKALNVLEGARNATKEQP